MVVMVGPLSLVLLGLCIRSRECMPPTRPDVISNHAWLHGTFLLGHCLVESGRQSQSLSLVPFTSFCHNILLKTVVLCHVLPTCASTQLFLTRFSAWLSGWSCLLILYKCTKPFCPAIKNVLGSHAAATVLRQNWSGMAVVLLQARSAYVMATT